MIFTWFAYSICATLLLGLSMVFYKFPSAKNIDKYGVMFWSLLIGGVLSLVFFHQYLSMGDGRMLFWAMLWGASFAALSLLQMCALSHVDTGTLFPVTSTLSLVATLVIGFFVFTNEITNIQTIGVFVSVCSVFLFLYKKGKLNFSHIILGIGFAIICLSALNKIIQKIVADGFDIHAFQIYQYLFATLFSLLVYLISQKSFLPAKLFERKQITLGTMTGVLGFFGAYALLTALTKGPFALVFSVQSTYVFIVALAGYFIFKEELSYRKIVALVLAFVAILLIRLG